MNKKLNVLLIDDHEMFCKGTKKLLEQLRWVDTCEDACSLSEGLQKLARLQPDILLLDLYIGKDISIYSVPRIKELTPNTKIIILTISDEPEDLRLAAKYKVDGYLAKSSPIAKIEEYIQAIHKGEVCISDSLAGALYQALMMEEEKNPPLTPQEQVVLTYLNRGYTNKEISSELNISLFTVKNHVSNIMRKLKVTRRYQLITKSKP